jgi:hypothetical protein
MKKTKLSGDQERPGTNRIGTVQLFDLVSGSDEVSVVMKVARTENKNSSLKEVKQTVLDSPWREDDMAKAQIEQSTNSSHQLKDPVAALRKANELLSRR